MTEDEEDIRLMQLVRAGDTDAFETLILRHQHRVYGTIAKMLGDSDEAEDLAQAVFVRVWQSARRYKPRAKFTTWLLTITRNLVFNEMRRRKRHPAEPLDTAAGDHAPRMSDTSQETPAQTLLEEELQRQIDRAISELPETQRLALVLRRYQELSYEEIADVLKVTVPSVKSLLFRARTQLKETLSAYLE